MTAPNGPILFNSSSGNDAAASGLGPDPAETGSGADLDATSTVDLSADSPDLSGVSSGDLLWVDTSSGRQFSIIASVDNTAKTVTCDDAFTVTETGKTWAIGGKRASIGSNSSRTLFAASGGAKPGWTMRLQSGYTETLTSRILMKCAGDVTGRIVLEGDPNAAVQPVITKSNSDQLIVVQSDYCTLRNFEAKSTDSTASTQNSALETTALSSCVLFEKIKANDTNLYNGLHISSADRPFGVLVLECQISNVQNVGILIQDRGAQVVNCVVSDCGSHGIYVDYTTQLGISILGCLCADNGGSGIAFGQNNDSIAGRSTVMVVDNLSANNTDDGILLETNNDQIGLYRVRKNILAANGRYGLNCSASSITTTDIVTIGWGRNAFYLNTSGHRNNVNAGPNDIPLTADPFLWSKTLSGVSWVASSKTLTKVGAFSDVTTGQKINITAGTGVTETGLYEIASVDSADQITLAESIAASDAADIETEPCFNINNDPGGGALLRAATVVMP